MYSEHDRLINEVNIIEKIVNRQDCSIDLSLMRNYINMNQEYKEVMSSRLLDLITKLNLEYEYYDLYYDYFYVLSSMLSKILDKNIDIAFYRDTFLYVSFSKYYDKNTNLNKLTEMISSAKIVEDSFMIFILSSKISILLDEDEINIDELLCTNNKLKQLIK